VKTSERQLSERLTVAVEVVADSLTRLDRPVDAGPPFRTCGKQLVEAALLLACASRALGQRPHPANSALATMAERLDAMVRTESTATMLLRLPRLAASGVGVVHAALTEFGIEDGRFDRGVRSALRSPHSRMGERLPFRELEGEWIRWKVLPEAPEPATRLPRSALIAGRPHPVYMQPGDVDALTHGLWYLTDFGRLAPAAIDGDFLARIVDLLSAWQAALGAAGQVAELLIGRAVLRAAPSGHSEAADALVDRWWRAELAEKPTGPPDPSRAHDTTICGLLFALQISGRGLAPASGGSEAARAAFRIDGGLIRAVRRYDLGTAAHLLQELSGDPEVAAQTLAAAEVRSFLRQQCDARKEMTMEHPAGADRPAVEQHKALLREVYDRAAPAYGRQGGAAFAHFGTRLVERAGLAPAMSVLDVGVGRGAALWPALDAVGPTGRVVGVDLSTEMIRHLADDLLAVGRANADVAVMDAERLEFEDQAFDAVLCSQALPFFPDPAQALAEMFRVLRPAGILAIATKAAFDRRWAWDSRLLAPYPHAAVRMVGVPFADAGQLGEALVRAGFVSFRAAVEEVELVFEEPGDYWDYVWSTGLRASLDRLTPDELATYRRACDAELQRMAREGGIRQRYQVLLADARRPAEAAAAAPASTTVAGAHA